MRKLSKEDMVAFDGYAQAAHKAALDYALMAIVRAIQQRQDILRRMKDRKPKKL